MSRTDLTRRFLLAAGAGALAVSFFIIRPLSASEEPVIIPAPAVDVQASADGLQTAVVAGGCFWGIQGIYQHTKGVTNAVSGYSGGLARTAKYEIVGRGTTGHAEAVEIKYDPKQISYGKLLQILFSVGHDPTQLNRQGPDVGTQYRSAIFPVNAEQKKVAEAYIAQLNAAKVYRRPIATTVEQLNGFYAAEDYHQDYATNNPSQPYIVYNDLPKIENLKKVFADIYREKPALVRDAKATN